MQDLSSNFTWFSVTLFYSWTHSLCVTFCFEWPEASGEEEEQLGTLTTVQQRGQNHQRRARARSRNRISRAIARMEPSDCGAKREGGQPWGRPCVQLAREPRVGQGNSCGLPLP